MKKCKKCGNEKEYNDFYISKSGKYGLNARCKECIKNKTKEYLNEKKKDFKWVLKERDRCLKKSKKNGLRYKASKETIIHSTNMYKINYPEKIIAHNRSRKVLATIKGNHMHHWSYNEEHWKDVIELSPLDHRLLHRHLIYDQEFFMYRRIDTMELMDTRQLNEDFINFLKNNKYAN